MLELEDVWRGLVEPAADFPQGWSDRPITAVVTDSRAVTPGALFVALHGEKTDGHLYVADALARGAVAVIAEPRAAEILAADARPSDRAFTFVSSQSALRNTLSEGVAVWEDGRSGNRLSSHPPPLPVVFLVPDSLSGLQRLAAYWRARMPAITVGITGSVGKTTSKEIVANVLSQRFSTLRSEGNLNNEIGLPLTLLRLTPQHERTVLEMGMYALGEIANLARLAQPRIGIVTNIGPTHLERLGSIERIAQAKAELVQALPPADQGGVAILNADDPLVRAMAGLTQARVVTYGLNQASDLWADEISSEGLEGIRFVLHRGPETIHLKLPMLGRHSVHTALRGAAAGVVEGLSWTEIVAGLQEVCGQLRLMVVPGLHDTTLIDDTYNASPASMLAALNLLQDLANAEHRTIAVLGDMLELGSYEEEGHRLVGGRAGPGSAPSPDPPRAGEAGDGRATSAVDRR